MRNITKKFIIIAILLSFSAAYAKDNIKFVAQIGHDFSVYEQPQEVQFKTQKKMVILNEIEIPQRSIITMQTIQAQRERRWHKSGYILCKLKSYKTETGDEPIDISDKNIYMIARKYEPVNKKEVAITGTEILLAQAASFFAPGVDILYFFTKGAIQRKKDPHWFKAGVSNAYENSICWFWLKGKPIEVQHGDLVKIKDIKEEKVFKLKDQIEKRNAKLAIKQEKKELKAAKKLAKAEEKRLKKYKYNEQEAYTVLTEAIIDQTIPTEYFFPEEKIFDDI